MKRGLLLGLSTLVFLSLAGCSQTPVGNDGGTTDVSNKAVSNSQLVQNGTFTGSSKHWTATLVVIPSPPVPNSNQPVNPTETLTVKYKGSNSTPTGDSVSWSLKTPSVTVGGTGVWTKNDEITSKGEIGIPKDSVLTVTIQWGGQTETLNLTSH